jgi:hypothetical protein
MGIGNYIFNVNDDRGPAYAGLFIENRLEQYYLW